MNGASATLNAKNINIVNAASRLLQDVNRNFASAETVVRKSSNRTYLLHKFDSIFYWNGWICWKIDEMYGVLTNNIR